jgi:O-antigen ligase
VVFALLGFWSWGMVSAAAAPNQMVAWVFVEELTKIMLPFLVGITTINSVRQLKQLAWVILLSQGYVAYELNMSYLGGFNRVVEIGFGGMDNNCVAIAMNSCIGLAFFLGVYAERWWQKAVALGMALLMAHVILFSFSRGGMLGLIITGAIAFFLIPKRPVHFAVLVVAVLVMVRLAGPEVRERFIKRFISSFADKESRDASAESRMELWSNCLDCTARHPVLGLGPRHFPLVAPQYGWTPGKEAHTTWLQVAAELGLPGLFFLALFYSLCVARLVPVMRPFSEVPDPWLRYLACMVVASIVGFAVSAQFVTLSGLEHPYYVTLVGAGVLKLSSTHAGEERAGGTGPEPEGAFAPTEDAWEVTPAGEEGSKAAG